MWLFRNLYLWHSTEAVAFFSLPVLTLIFPALLPCIERLSLHCSPNWKIMDLINWSLNAIDTIFSMRSLGSGEPVCPDGTFAAGYTMDAWERWRIVCLAALSMEDIEDIYLFGTMITGLMLIGLGFSWVIEKFRKREQLSKASQGCPSWLKLWEERSALRLRLSIAIWILSRSSSRLYKGKLIILEIKMDRESSLQNWNAFTRPKDKTILYFSGSPYTVALARLLLESTPGEQCSETLLLPPPTLQTFRHCPSPDHSPHVRFDPLAWSSGSDLRRISGCGTGWLLSGPDSLPLWLCRVSMVYVLLCCWGVFPVPTLYSPRSIVWGCYFFPPHFPHVMLFLQFYLHFTTDYTLYDCVCDE